MTTKNIPLICTGSMEHCDSYLTESIIYLSLDSERESYYSWIGKHRENESLDGVYDFLEKLGYEMSDEEKALKEGTHELFVREEMKI